MTGTAPYLTVKKPYFFGEHMGRVEFTWMFNGNAFKRYPHRVVQQRVETVLPACRHGAERSVQISIVTLDTLKGINIQSADSV